MNKIAFVFPGQGAQKVGMGKGFYDQYETARQIFDESNEELDFDLLKICFEENEQINETMYTQPAIVTACLAMAQVLIDEGIKPDVTAGLSLGAYAALGVTGALSYRDAVATVAKRGRFMQEAVPNGQGAMSAVLGLTGEAVEEVIKDNDEVTIANYNCPGQIVITGMAPAVAAMAEPLTAAGAKRVVPLKVSGPFHSPYLVKAGERLEEELKNVALSELAIPYVSNIDGAYVTDASEVKGRLVKQISSSVRWEQSVRTMIAQGVDTFVEIGPGKTLTGFLKKISKEVTGYSVQEPEDIVKLKEALKVC